MAYAILAVLSMIFISSVLGSLVIYERYEDSIVPRRVQSVELFDGKSIEREQNGTPFFPDTINGERVESQIDWKTEMSYPDSTKDEDDFNPHVIENEPITAEHSDHGQRRERRSPQEPGKRGSVSVSAGHTRGQHGQPSQSSVRTDYNHNLWRGRNGATLDANAYHQRNWGGGRRNDYGGGLTLRVPIGRRRH